MVFQNANNFEWIGERLSTNSQSREFFKNKVFYSGFKLGEWTVNLEDFVLVKKAGEDLNMQNFSVARINYLYEEQQPSSTNSDPCKAVVQWYSWPMDIPQSCFYDNVIVDFENEVIEDFRITNPIVNISNFMYPCHVLYASPTEVASEVIEKASEEHGIDGVIYLCKYRIIENTGNSVFIEPIEVQPDVELITGITGGQQENPNNGNKQTTKRHTIIAKKNPTKRRKIN